ncbi:MAG: hypothetical protein QM725_08365 [Lacibacter sp.]
MFRIICLMVFLFGGSVVFAQIRGNRNLMQNIPSGGSMRSGSGGGAFKDTLLHRTGLEDSATTVYRYLDTVKFNTLDSSVNDFYKRWPVSWTNVYLGNTGSAAKSLLFSPIMKAGWDHGFHSYDAYIPDVFDTKIYNTTRPYTQLAYILGPNQEQNIHVLHTQNYRKNLNFTFRYNLINAPGVFSNQKTNHSNLHFNSWYTGKRKRYTAYFIASSAKTGATEGGGLTDLSVLNDNNRLNSLFPTIIGGSNAQTQTLFSNKIYTGNQYHLTNILFRHHYDVGKKDSVVTDSSVVYLFFPRFRFQHTLQFNKYTFAWHDENVDTAGYKQLYQLTNLPETFGIKDYWQTFTNEAAVYSYPDINNQLQFLKVAAAYQTLHADFGTNEPSFTNLFLNGEYRNKTKNKKWDMELAGTLYLAGFNGGDYSVVASLKRLIGQKLGYLTLGFQNVNRSPSVIHDDMSNFKKFNIGNTSFKKENTTIASATYELPQQRLEIGAKYFIAGNYIYFSDYAIARQEATLFNVLQLHLQKHFKIRRHWNWYTEIYIQQATGSAPVHVPLVLTRNRFAYEGFFFKSISLSTGLEARYHTPYKADEFSPLLGQFFLQNKTTINNLPDVAAYLHFRVRTFYLFLRAENLNTLELKPKAGFYNNNMATPLQPVPAYFLRFGIYWGFIN